MFDDEFNNGNSIFHNADPRVKTILAFLIIISVILSNNITTCGVILVFLMISIFIARLSVLKVTKRVLVVNSFVVFLWFFLPFSTPGREIFHIHGLSASYEGIYQAILITLKANSAVLTIICFINTTSVPILGHGLYRLKFPPKFILLLLLTYRYISVIFEEFSKMLNAARVRNFHPKTNLHTYRTYSYMLAMVLIKSYERGKRVYNAMMLRGFNGRFYSLQDLTLSKNDIIIAYLSLFFIVISNFSSYIQNFWR